RVRAAQLTRCRRTIAFRPSDIGRGIVRDLVCQADTWIEVGVRIGAIELGGDTGLIRQPDQSEVEPTAQGRSKAGRDVEGVGGIRAEIAVGADDTRRRFDRWRCSRAEALIDDLTRAEDRELRQQRTEFAVSRIAGNAVVPGETDHQIVFSVKNRIGDFRLKAGADSIRVGHRDVDFAGCRPWRQHAGWHLIAVRIEQYIGRIKVLSFEAEKVAVVGAGRDVGQVAVDQMLVEMPIVDVAGEQLKIARLVRSSELYQFRLVMYRLRNSEIGSYILGELLYRRRPGRAEDIVRGRDRKMNGERIALPP